MKKFVMTSRWGVQLESDKYYLNNIDNKINLTVTSLSSYFTTRIGDTLVLRTSIWDQEEDPLEVEQLARTYVALIRSCVDVLDGMGPLEVGTIYEFDAAGAYRMSRRSNMVITVVPNKTTNSADFNSLVTRVLGSEELAQIYAELQPNASWVEIYRCLERLEVFHGLEHAMRQKFLEDWPRIKKMKQTANSYRHAKGKYPVRDPMSQSDAHKLLLQIMRKTAHMLPPVEPLKRFDVATEVGFVAYDAVPGKPTSLKELSLDNTIVTSGMPVGTVIGTIRGVKTADDKPTSDNSTK